MSYMSRLGVVLLAACVVVLPCSISASKAGYLTGSDLLQSCSPQKIDPVYRLKVAECRGYVVGVADTFDCTNDALGFKWNSQHSLSQEELVNTVLRWLNAHPGQLRYQAGGLIAAALADAFPCNSIASGSL